MSKKENNNKAILIFAITLIAIIGFFIAAVVKTDEYNSTNHSYLFEKEELFAEEDPRVSDVSVVASARNSTWSKIFDFNNEGITDYNYQAYTYDFNIINHTKDEVDDFSFELTFDKEVYLSSGWNGSVEIHQHINGRERVSTIPDLREFNPNRYYIVTVEVDGETLIPLSPGDYFKYLPSFGINAMEIPIEPEEATTPGFILYVATGENIEGSKLLFNYSFNRLLTSEPLFWISASGMVIWSIALVIFAITSSQIKKYNERHMRDNEIINESIETFIGFIDAKDPYTNGHSKRVAKYTRMIAQEMGFEGEELDRIYYKALLHDCGKIGVPDNILRKPGKLTDDEFEVIKSHTTRGGDVLSRFKSLENVGQGALYHHERFDGRGYPEGKAGKDIPLIARMICVADSFDAMNTNRVYRKKLSKEAIISEIETNKGKQFDPEIADIMLKLIREGKIQIEEEEQSK